MIKSIKYKVEKDFHDKVLNINQINSSSDNHLTTKLNAKKGKLEGRFITSFKTFISYIPFVHLARTSPGRVAKTVAEFAVYHQKKGFFNTLDKSSMLDSLNKLEQKVKVAKGEKFLKRHQKAIKTAYDKINNLEAKPLDNRNGGDGKNVTPPIIPVTPIVKDGKDSGNKGKSPAINPPNVEPNQPSQPEPVQPKPKNQPKLKPISDFTTVESAKEYIFESLKNKNEKGLVKLVKDGFQKGIDVNSKDEMGDTLLIVALTNKHYKVVKLLLKNGASPTEPSSGKFSPLHFALLMTVTENNIEKLTAKPKDYKILKLLLSKLPKWPTLDSPIGVTPYTVRTRLEEIKKLNPKVEVKIRKLLKL